MKNKFRNVLKTLKRRWKNVDGQDLVEYALLLLFVSLAAVATAKTFGKTLSNTFANVNTDLLVYGSISTGASGADVTAAQNSGSVAADDAAQAANNAAANSEQSVANAALAGRNLGAYADDQAAAGLDSAAAFADGLAAVAAQNGIFTATVFGIGIGADQLSADANNDVAQAAADEAAAAATTGTTTRGTTTR